MNRDIPDSSAERKTEALKELKEFLWTTGKFEATPEEVEEFNRLLNEASSEELEVKRYNLTAQSEDVVREWLDATGTRQDELDKLNTELWRKLAVCQAAINTRKINS